jgi:hypothetical protein
VASAESTSQTWNKEKTYFKNKKKNKNCRKEKKRKKKNKKEKKKRESSVNTEGVSKVSGPARCWRTVPTGPAGNSGFPRSQGVSAWRVEIFQLLLSPSLPLLQ